MQSDFEALQERLDGKTIDYDLRLPNGLEAKGRGVVWVSTEGQQSELVRVWIQSDAEGMAGVFIDTTLSRGLVDLIQPESARGTDLSLQFGV